MKVESNMPLKMDIIGEKIDIFFSWENWSDKMYWIRGIKDLLIIANCVSFEMTDDFYLKTKNMKFSIENFNSLRKSPESEVQFEQNKKICGTQ